jgi:mono/diheme cytochrome c family protein
MRTRSGLTPEASQPTPSAPFRVLHAHASASSAAAGIIDGPFMRRTRNPLLDRRMRGLIATVVMALGPTALFAAATQNGWYTPAQATRGHQFFNNQCAQCHRPDLTGAAGPALVGPTFLAKWGNQPLSALYTFEHKNMPAWIPGRRRRAGRVGWNSRAREIGQREAIRGCAAISGSVPESLRPCAVNTRSAPDCDD